MGRVQVPTAVTVLVVRLRAGVIAKLVTLLAGAAGFLFGFIGALYFSRLLKLDLVSQECAVAVGTVVVTILAVLGAGSMVGRTAQG